MAFADWEERYSVHIEVIDKQHKHLLDMINQLFEACQQGKEAADTYFRDTVKESVDYVKTHFKTEEDLMHKYEYPYYTEHKQEHEAFIMRLLEYVSAFQQGKQFVPNNYVRFLKDWLLEHIAVSDKKYESFFREKGVT